MKLRTVALFICCLISCDSGRHTSSIADPILTASGVRPNVVFDNHGGLNALSKAKLDGTDLAGSDEGRQMLTLLVACAFDSSTTFHVSFNGEDLEFFGETGLAPEWETGALSDKNRRWVSACVISHLSKEGLPVVISLRGKNRDLVADSDEKLGWPLEEGAFFGNIFNSGYPIHWFACKGQGTIPDGVDRRCAQPDSTNDGLTECGITFIGNCSDVCVRNSKFYTACFYGGKEFREIITIHLQTN